MDRSMRSGQWTTGLALVLFSLVAVGLALATFYHFSFYLRLPADILGFWEGNYVADLIKIRTGSPIYTPPTDNSSSVYTPGAQLLSHGIASLFGRGDSIATLRFIQFGYVVLAGMVAAAAARNLSRKLLGEHEFTHQWLWFVAWWALLFLVGTEDRFNQNVHTLHPDGLTLLISAIGFWLLTRYWVRPHGVWIPLMAAVPAAGFWVKQSLLIWGPLAVVFLWFAGGRGRRHAIECTVLGIVLSASSLALLRWVGGPDMWFWVFDALGSKDVSLLRSGWNLMSAGTWVAMGIAALYLLVLPSGSRQAIVLWLIWAGLIVIEGYTSGIGWQMNHLGPGVLIAAAWFLSAVPRLQHRSREVWAGRFAPAGAFAVSAFVLLLFGGLGLVREPQDPVSPDVYRYIEDIEREFAGSDASRILLDRGSWVYLPDGLVMRDRASSTAVHMGLNQPVINHAMLTETIRRFRQQTYARILVRDLDNGGSYDPAMRGGGLREALLESYVEVRRIPGVADVTRWWPRRLLADISVLEPRRDAAAGRPSQ